MFDEREDLVRMTFQTVDGYDVCIFLIGKRFSDLVPTVAVLDFVEVQLRWFVKLEDMSIRPHYFEIGVFSDDLILGTIEQCKQLAMLQDTQCDGLISVRIFKLFEIMYTR